MATRDSIIGDLSDPDLIGDLGDPGPLVTTTHPAADALAWLALLVGGLAVILGLYVLAGPVPTQTARVVIAGLGAIAVFLAFVSIATEVNDRRAP